MVLDFFPNTSKKQSGYYAGYLDSAYFIGILVGSLVWTRLSDYYGRKPVLLLGLFLSAICAVLFGLSSLFGYYAAIGIRFVWGSLGGDIAVAKTVLG